MLIRVVTLFLSLWVFSVNAWNLNGHRVIGQIAYNHLDPIVKAQCNALIAVPVICGATNDTFVSAAAWADQRCESATAPQHYLDIPFSLDGYPTNEAPNNPTNVVTAIQQYMSVLQDSSAATTNRAKALRYLIHFVGDIQQPLHCSTGVSSNRPTGDLGGNTFYVGGSSLHSFWDGAGGYLLDNVSVSNKAAEIEAAFPYTLSVAGIPDPMTWAVEGWDLARTNVYVGVTNGFSATASYTNRTRATSMERLALGGHRLAKFLNTLFVTNSIGPVEAHVENQTIKLSWSAVSGRNYRIQWKHNLEESWHDLMDVTAAGVVATGERSIEDDQRFYRIVVVN